MSHLIIRLVRFCRKLATFSCLPAYLIAAYGLQAAPETNGTPAINPTVITNLNQLWEVPDAEKSQLHPIRMKVLIYYCDPNWNVFWGRFDGHTVFLPLQGLPVPLKAGDEIFIDGLVIPGVRQIYWDKTSITTLSESNEVPAVPVQGRLLTMGTSQMPFVEAECLVETIRSASSNVFRLGLLSENFSLNAFVHLDHPPDNLGDHLPDLVGKYVRIRGVYARTVDAFGKTVNLTLWTPGLDFIQPTGSLESDSRFSIRPTPSENFASANPKIIVHVAGTVRSQQPGEAVTIWDDTGQIRILTKQRRPLHLGDRIEAIGYPLSQGFDRVLMDGLFRPVARNSTNSSGVSSKPAKLCLADQIRGLDKERIEQRPPASIEGIVTWVDSRTNFIYVLDSSGGIRVMQSRLDNGRRIQQKMLVKVDGVASMGEFTPDITNAVVHQTGSTELPDAPLTSLEQALTGTEDGRWIQMRGYVRKVTETNRRLEVQLVAPGGEFTARIPRDDSLNNLAGSVVLVSGVCVATANSRRQLTGIEIWSAASGDVQTEQFPPDDLFALPLRSLASLRQFNLFNTLNERVRTSGSVTLHVPGRYLYVQDGDTGIFALSDQTDPLQPGDRVELVGFSGNSGGDFLMREAVYRRTAHGPEPAPVQLPAVQSLNENLDGLLVCAEGLLLDIVNKPSETRLIVQAKGLIFEVKLDKATDTTRVYPAIGSRLALTGVYRIQRDESGKPRSFLLNLRETSDIRVLEPAPWWTLSRLLLVLAGMAFVFLLALLWTLATRRKNNLLQQAQVELKAAHDKLEERVQERTRELRKQIEAKGRAQEALRRSEERFAKAFRANPVPLTLQGTADQRYVDVNDSFLQMTGFKREEVLGCTPGDLKLFPHTDAISGILTTLSTKQGVRDLQTDLYTHDEKNLTVLISAEPFELENQMHFLTSVQDITERLNVESQLRQAQKMEVVGQIAAGVAHDFNNILTVIQGHAELQLNVEKLETSLADSLREISRASARAASLTRQLLAFSRKQVLQRRPLDVREELGTVSKMLRRIIGEHIALHVRCAPDLPPVFADAVNFEQIIINLAVNARDAMPRGGPLIITAETITIDTSHLEREPDAVVGSFVRLSITDEGCGMTEAVRSKIFEPFFTTKEVGKGTGMGLATVYGIVKQHQGWIEVESQVGVGSTFKVFLPVARAEADNQDEAGTDLIRAKNVEPRTIFIVEDERPLREMASTILKRLGHRVLEAKDGPEALSLWPKHRGEIDLLLTDMVMPGGMTGRELAGHLLHEKPQMRVIYSSGYSIDLSDSSLNLVEGVNFLFKPYDATTLARIVKKAFTN